jgi:hypothetical protein
MNPFVSVIFLAFSSSKSTCRKNQMLFLFKFSFSILYFNWGIRIKLKGYAFLLSLGVTPPPPQLHPFPVNPYLCDTLYRESYLCIPRKGIARPQSQFRNSCVCERFIYSQDRSVDRWWKYINHDTWKLGLRPRNSFSGNICIKFSVLCLCSVGMGMAYIS